jgi:predicted nucleotidyltransferase component of viral defense system
MRWHEEVLDVAGMRAAARLAPIVGSEFYLAGGTALALRLGHRVSLDLDLFSQKNPLKEEQRHSLLLRLQASGKIEIMESKDGTCHLRVERTATSLFHYPYALLDPTDNWNGLRIASLQDIAAMKVGAVIGRGSRKDFVDLYGLSMEIGLETILNSAAKKFPDHSDIAIQAARAMVYFQDAEKEPMPRLLRPLAWSKVKSFFEAEIPKAVRSRISKP